MPGDRLHKAIHPDDNNDQPDETNRCTPAAQAGTNATALSRDKLDNSTPIGNQITAALPLPGLPRVVSRRASPGGDGEQILASGSGDPQADAHDPAADPHRVGVPARSATASSGVCHRPLAGLPMPRVRRSPGSATPRPIARVPGKVHSRLINDDLRAVAELFAFMAANRAEAPRPEAPRPVPHCDPAGPRQRGAGRQLDAARPWACGLPRPRPALAVNGAILSRCPGAGSRHWWRLSCAIRRRALSCPAPARPRPARTPAPAGRARPQGGPARFPG